jgi:predicted alpha/beta superfamily hydrolase
VKNASLTGDIRHFPDHRTIVYLPPGYQKRINRTYPVLYLQDGQNVFDGETSFIRGQEWFVDETAEWMIRTGRIEPLIVAAIYNAGDARIDEYTPSVDESLRRGGKADAYLNFLITEIKPFIDRQFRTRRSALNTGIGGSSLGGLLSLYAGLKHPTVFGKLAVMSPSLWWDQERILKQIGERDHILRQRIWLDIGTEEGAIVEEVRRLRALFESRGQDFHYEEAQGAGHNELAWASRVGPMLKYLFPQRDSNL